MKKITVLLLLVIINLFAAATGGLGDTLTTPNGTFVPWLYNPETKIAYIKVVGSQEILVISHGENKMEDYLNKGFSCLVTVNSSNQAPQFTFETLEPTKINVRQSLYMFYDSNQNALLRNHRLPPSVEYYSYQSEIAIKELNNDSLQVTSLLTEQYFHYDEFDTLYYQQSTATVGDTIQCGEQYYELGNQITGFNKDDSLIEGRIIYNLNNPAETYTLRDSSLTSWNLYAFESHTNRSLAITNAYGEQRPIIISSVDSILYSHSKIPLSTAMDSFTSISRAKLKHFAQQDSPTVYFDMGVTPIPEDSFNINSDKNHISIVTFQEVPEGIYCHAHTWGNKPEWTWYNDMGLDTRLIFTIDTVFNDSVYFQINMDTVLVKVSVNENINNHLMYSIGDTVNFVVHQTDSLNISLHIRDIFSGKDPNDKAVYAMELEVIDELSTPLTYTPLKKQLSLDNFKGKIHFYNLRGQKLPYKTALQLPRGVYVKNWVSENGAILHSLKFMKR